MGAHLRPEIGLAFAQKPSAHRISSAAAKVARETSGASSLPSCHPTMMLYFNMALPFVALVCLSAIAMADPLVPTPNNLTDVTLSPRDVNVFICSWKVGDGSPQDLGYAKV